MIVLYTIIFTVWALCTLYAVVLCVYFDMKNPKLFMKRLFDSTSHLDEAFGKYKKQFIVSFVLAIILLAPALYSLLKVVAYYRGTSI